MSIHSEAVTKPPAWSGRRSFIADSSILATFASDRPLTSMSTLGTVRVDLTVVLRLLDFLRG